MSDALAVFFLGLACGATTCSVTCMPYLAPYLLLSRRGFREGVSGALAYLAGKATTYAVLGTAAGAAGQVLLPGAETALRPLQGWMLVLTGLALPFLSGGICARKAQVIGRSTSLFTLGAATSLMPCLPVSSMLVAAAQSGAAVEGFACGLLYGAALVISPLLIGGGILALIGRTIHTEARQFLPYLRGLSMAMLVGRGIGSLI